MMPVSVITGQTGRLYAKHGAHLPRADFRNQMLESGALHLAGTQSVQDPRRLSRPAGSQVGKRGRPSRIAAAGFRGCALPVRATTDEYRQRHDASDGLPNFRIHASSPEPGSLASIAAFNSTSASAIASSRCLSVGNIIGWLSSNLRNSASATADVSGGPMVKSGLFVGRQSTMGNRRWCRRATRRTYFPFRELRPPFNAKALTM